MPWDRLGLPKRARVSCSPSQTHLGSRGTDCDLGGKESIISQRRRKKQGHREGKRLSQGHTALWQDPQPESKTPSRPTALPPRPPSRLPLYPKAVRLAEGSNLPSLNSTPWLLGLQGCSVAMVTPAYLGTISLTRLGGGLDGKRARQQGGTSCVPLGQGA